MHKTSIHRDSSHDTDFTLCVQIREMMADTMHKVVSMVTGSRLTTQEVLSEHADLTQHKCYRSAMTHFKYNCFNWHRTEVNKTPEDHVQEVILV